MQSASVRDAALQHLAANKIKAAAMVLERHMTEPSHTEKDAPSYGIDTFELDTALRKGMETLEYLREVQTTTQESRIKAAVPSTVNREFREQSDWWLPKQELPKSWFPAPPNVTAKTPTGSRAPRPVSPKHQPPSTPVAARPRPSSGGALRVHGLSDGEVALALGDVATGLAHHQAAMAGAGGEQNHRGATGKTASVGRTSRTSSGIIAGKDSPRGPGAVLAAAAERVAWALRSRRGASSSGAELPGNAPVLYDGGGDEAVPGAGPSGLTQPPPGYPRYTLNLFEQQQQLRVSQRQRGDEQEQGTDGGPLLIRSDEEDEDEGGGEGSGSSGVALGTGFRALADEEPRSSMQHMAVSSAIHATAARVAASNAEAKGSGGGRMFGMVGSAAAGAPPQESASPTSPTPGSRKVRRHPAPHPEAHADANAPEMNPFARQSSNLTSSLRSRHPGGTGARTSSPGFTDMGGHGGGGSTSEAGEMPLLPASSTSASGAHPGLFPTPPPLQLESRTSTSLRLGGRTHRSVLHLDSASQRGSAPCSPQATRVALSGMSGRLRLGATSASGIAPVAPDATEGSISPVGGSSGGAKALRARLRVLAVPGGAGDDDGRSPGAALFSRSLLAPASPSGPFPPLQLESSNPNAAHTLYSRFSDRSLLVDSRSANSLDAAPPSAAPQTAAAGTGGGGGGGGADAASNSTSESFVTASLLPVGSLSRTTSRRTIFRQSVNGEPVAAPDAPQPPPQQQHPDEDHLPCVPAIAEGAGTAAVYEGLTSTTMAAQKAMLARRLSSNGGRAFGGTGASMSPHSPLSPALGSEPEGSAGHSPLPAVPSPPQRPQHLMRMSSRSFDTTLPPHLDAPPQVATDTILEEPDADSSSESVGVPQRGLMSFPALMSPRGSFSPALLPSPRTSAAGAPAVAAPLFNRRVSITPPPDQMAVSVLVGGKDAPLHPLDGGSGRTRRSSTSSTEAPQVVNQRFAQMRSTQSGGQAEGRPWETPPISPRLVRGPSISGNSSGGGSAGGSGGGAAPLPATVMATRQQLPGPSGGVSGMSTQARGAAASPARGDRISIASALEEMVSPMNPVPGDDYRLSVGPMPVSKRRDTPVIKNTLDI